MTLSAITARVRQLPTKLRFLRGRWRWVIAWPAAAAVLAGIAWTALLSDLDADRRHLETSMLRGSAALSRSYADHLSRTVEAVDQILLHVKFEWELTGGRLRLEDTRERGLFPDPSFFNVAIADRNGKMITSALPGAPTMLVDDRTYFTAHKHGNGEDFLYIGMPVVSRITDKYVIVFSRRIDAADGSFGGIVLASVTPDYLTANYDRVTLGEHGLLGAIGSDGAVRAARTGAVIHTPQSPAMVSTAHFDSPSGSALLDGAQAFADKRSRYVGWQTVGGYPLIAVTGLDQQDALAGYRERRDSTLLVAIVISFALAALTAAATATAVLLAYRKYQLELTHSAYRMATEGGSEGFYIVRPVEDRNGAIKDFRIVDCNQQGAEFFRQRRDELLGKTLSDLYAGAHPERMIQSLRRALETGIYEADAEVAKDSPLTPLWIHLKIVRTNGELAITLRDISESKAHIQELEKRWHEDVLTGLPNRPWVLSYLAEAIARAVADDTMLAVLFIDLDGFKKINDRLGHEVGDDLLRNAARRLKEAVRPHDRVARLGGDEFVVILEHIGHQTEAAYAAERILHAFKESFRLSTGQYSMGASIGISLFPADGTDARALLEHADIAMYSVKTDGKGNYRFYDQKFYDALRLRIEREAELRRAIQLDEFVLYYQPRVDLSTGATSSMEALVRWQHPAKGLLGPLDFIPLAEETGLILGLGELVIDKVCAQLAVWSATGQQLVPVSVNVSSRQFNEADIASVLAAALARHGVDAGQVEVEITESTMMGESRSVSNALKAIRRMGVKLLVDDFGTGFSSLSQLHRLDFDVLKVDRAFTIEIDKSERGNVFFKAIITMAHALGMRVVAEGVENEAQVRILRELRCDEIQGYYVSRPLPGDGTQPILPTRRFESVT